MLTVKLCLGQAWLRMYVICHFYNSRVRETSQKSSKKLKRKENCINLLFPKTGSKRCPTSIWLAMDIWIIHIRADVWMYLNSGCSPKADSTPAKTHKHLQQIHFWRPAGFHLNNFFFYILSQLINTWCLWPFCQKLLSSTAAVLSGINFWQQTKPA